MNQDEIKEKIYTEIIKTEKLIDEYKDFTKPIAPDNSYGRLSRMDAIINKSVIESRLVKAEEKITNLNRVLGMIGTDDFGKCISCWAEIPIERVLYRPESLHCINCAK